MKNTIKFSFIVLCCIVASCQSQNNERETESLQHHDDSLRAAIEAEASGNLQRQNDSLKTALTVNAAPASNSHNQSANSANSTDVNRVSNTNSESTNSSNVGEKTTTLINAKFQLTRLNTLLLNTKAKLEYENNELSRVEQYHIGRMKGTREQEIRQQSIRVQAYQNLVQKIQDDIITTSNNINTLQSEISQTN